MTAARCGVPLLGVCLAVQGPAAGVTFRSDPDYLIDSWETADGLPENSATAMAQTADGFLWFGTFNGLVRFDGLKFTVFNRFNTPALPDNNIVNLHLDRQGRLWVSTGLGLVVRETMPVGSAEVDWRTLTAQDGWKGDLVRSFAERPNGDLLLTSFDGEVLEFRENRFTPLPPPPGEPGHGYFGGVDETGQWWVVQNRFVGRWDGSRWVSMLTPDPSVGRSAVACAAARDGALWILLKKELVKFREGREVLRLPLPRFSGGVWSMSEDSRTNVWICSYDSGLFRVSPAGDLHHWGETNGLGYHSTRFVFEDRERNLWVGTSGGGLRRYKPRRISDMTLHGPLASRVTRSVWPAADGRIYIASPDLGLFQREASGVSRVMVPGPRNTSGYGLSVMEDRRGRLWYGDTDHGWWRQDQLSFERIPSGPSKNANVSALFEDSQGRIWIGTRLGVVVLDEGAFRELGTAEGLPAGSVLCFAEASSRAIWLTGEQGVFRFDTGRFLEVRGTHGESLHDVLSLKAEPDGTMWLGTRDRGLLRWQKGRIHRVGNAVGLPVESVNAILEDGQGYYWMTSNRGIVRAARADLHAAANGDLRRLNCQLLDTSDGLPSVECATGQPACARDPAGRLWFATQKGVAMVETAKLDFNTLPPPVHIERVSFHRANTEVELEPADSGAKVDAAVVWLQPPFVRTLELPAGSRQLEIEYTALSLSSPDRIRFQVKLEGRGHDWENAYDQRVARFYELGPGNYVFRVRASNNDGVWNETGASLAFTVLPHFWQTPWFQFGSALFLAGLGGAAVWWQSRKHVRRALERERTANEIRELAGRLINAQEDERRRIARELHDDFSQRLALLSVEMELLGSAKLGAEPGSAPHLDEMATRVKELSTEVHRMAYELHPAKIDQLGLVAAARGFCRELSKQSGVSVQFDAGEFPRAIPSEVALCLYRLIQESLQNVVRHSGARTARVELRAQADHISLVITDSGTGFDVERARREGGLGLSSMQERVRLVRGTLIVKSGPGSGTRIEAHIPLTGGGPAGSGQT
ncbi:MAG: hypothetical protein KJ070_14190 [Verrucomicrobia bacterium]|nr:hypothetical protein [Verrucomicrobiota bacterium]